MRLIERVPTPALWLLVDRIIDRVDRKMIDLCSGGDGLRYGWDWPTAGVYWPHICRMYHRTCAELRRRCKASGLSSTDFVAKHCECK
jgi:hypothetical protein